MDLENDEKSTTFFFNKSKQVFQKKTLTKIKTDLDTEVSSPQEIRKELEQYYATLYKSTTSKQDQNILQPDDVTIKFTDVAKRACEGALTLQECTAALKSFKLNKSPGCDGLPAEYYVEFWQEIGDKLVECLNFGLARGTLALSQRRGVITL